MIGMKWQRILRRAAGVKKITLDDIFIRYPELTYGELYDHIRAQLDAGVLKPVKSSGTNGKSPALYRKYWVAEAEEDYSALEEELKYGLHPRVSVDYYLAHPKEYVQDREWVRMLSDYLYRPELLRRQGSVNERSFEIWAREKFLTKGPGKKILKRCGLDLGALNVYETGEPLAYYTHTRETPQRLLILENKDTFFSMRRHMLQGNSRILKEAMGTLIYGGGKRIWRSFRDLDICAEPYMKERANEICYFGDLDYEGIKIYESLAEMFRGRWEIRPFRPAYETMLEKAARIRQLPDTKEQQDRNISGLFFSYFGEETQERMRRILETGRYIPQEIINISDL